MPPQNIVFLTILTQFFRVVDRCISGCRIFSCVCPASSSVLLWIHAVRNERVNGEGFSYWSWTGAMIDHYTICWKYPMEIEHNHYISYFHKLAVAQHMTTNSSDVWSFCGANMNRPTHPQQIMPPPPPCQFPIMCGSVTTLQNGPSNKLTLEVFRGIVYCKNTVPLTYATIEFCSLMILTQFFHVIDASWLAAFSILYALRLPLCFWYMLFVTKESMVKDLVIDHEQVQW